MRDMTPELMQRYFENRDLGGLTIKIPDCGTVRTSLSHLFRSITGHEAYEYQTEPENIEAIAIYGSVLYKHFPVPGKTIQVNQDNIRGFLGLGKKVPRTIPGKREKPEDIDLMVITKEGLTDEKIIPTIKEDRYIEGFYGHYQEFITEQGLHIVYRSTDQFLEGIGNGDELSESVVKYGVPIVGEKRFTEIIRDVKNPTRENLHSFEWGEDSIGRLHGRII